MDIVKTGEMVFIWKLGICVGNMSDIWKKGKLFNSFHTWSTDVSLHKYACF